MVLIVVSHDEEVAHEARLVNKMFELGLTYFHLRKYDWDENRIKLFLNQINPEHQKKIILHSGFELSKEYPLNGIHLNTQNRNVYDKFKSQGYKIVSASFHSLNEIKENDKAYEYVFFGPVFDSISKPGYKGIANEGLRLEKQHKVVAIGGIEPANFGRVAKMGYYGIALKGYLWQARNIMENYWVIINTLRKRTD